MRDLAPGGNPKKTDKQSKANAPEASAKRARSEARSQGGACKEKENPQGWGKAPKASLAIPDHTFYIHAFPDKLGGQGVGMPNRSTGDKL